jgi:mevalonate kinase
MIKNAKEAREISRTIAENNEKEIEEIYDSLFNLILEFVEISANNGEYNLEIEMTRLDKRLFNKIIPLSAMKKFKDLGFKVGFDATKTIGGGLLSLYWGQ